MIEPSNYDLARHESPSRSVVRTADRCTENHLDFFLCLRVVTCFVYYSGTRYNEPLYNKFPAVTNHILQLVQSTFGRLCGTKPRYNEPLYNEIPDITNTAKFARYNEEMSSRD